MGRRISTRNARLIRTGIMKKCYPYKTGEGRYGDEPYYYTTLDFYRLWTYDAAYKANKHIPLVQRACERTEYFTQTREVGLDG